MADKFRNTFAIAISFTDGEIPTAAKMSGIASQAKTGQSLIELALGDIWNQSGDSIINNTSKTTNALMIPNIGRYLGSSRHLSPRIPRVTGVNEYTFDFTAFAGGHEAVLTFPPSPGESFTWAGVGTGPTGDPVSTLGAVNASGTWYCNTTNGYCYFFDAIAATWQVTYVPMVNGDTQTENFFNIIPDMDTDSNYDFQSVKIEYVNGTNNAEGYYIYLPPRGPLNTRRYTKNDNKRRAPQDNTHSPTHTGNYDTTPTTGNYLMWQDDSVDATTTGAYATHYRYNLPSIITDEWSSGARIPQGFIYLWDPTSSGTILDGLVFRAESAGTPRTWMFKVTGSALDSYLATSTGTAKYPTANLQSTSHAAAKYPSGGLRVVIVGSDISTCLSDLLYRFMTHNHSDDNYNDGLPTYPVKHGSLLDNFDPRDAGTRPYIDPSTLDNDHHPQYLHRKGLDASARDQYSNGMMGNLYFPGDNGNSIVDALTSDSFGCVFGSSTTGPKLYYTTTSDRMSFSSKSLKLEEAGAVYLQGSQSTKWIWIDLFACSSWSGSQTNLSYTWDSGNNEPYIEYENISPAAVVFEISDWPEAMATLHTIQLDWTQGGVNPISAYFYQSTWPATSGSNRTNFQMLRSGGAPNYLESPGAGRALTSYSLLSSGSAWTHATDKMLMLINFAQAGDRLYGCRLQVTYTTVSKWAAVS